MSKRPTNEYDIELYNKVFKWFQWGQAAVGIFLLFLTVLPLVHGVLAALTLGALLLSKWGWEKNAGRIFARLFSGLPWVFAVLLLATAVASLIQTDTTVAFLYVMCLIGGPLLTYQGLAAGIVSLHGGRYDRILACFAYTWLTLIALLATFSDIAEGVLWTVNAPVLTYLWVGLVTATALLSWLCLLSRTEEQKAAAKAKREAKKAART
ncbi:MAG: hypothetical protein IIW40_02620 [Clostridia bacterium]|nr:hypothetical protein [Clostridia bacterium]